jgi:hypothetical protein
MLRLQRRRLLHIAASNMFVAAVVHTSAAEQLSETNLGVDLPPALLLALSSSDRAEERVHLLESQTLGFGEIESDKGCAHGGEDAEEDVGAVLEMREHVGGDLADNEVVHPIETIST